MWKIQCYLSLFKGKKLRLEDNSFSHLQRQQVMEPRFKCKFNLLRVQSSYSFPYALVSQVNPTQVLHILLLKYLYIHSPFLCNFSVLALTWNDWLSPVSLQRFLNWIFLFFLCICVSCQFIAFALKFTLVCPALWYDNWTL